MPSIRNPFSLLLPCTVAVDCRKRFRSADVDLVQDDARNHARDAPHVDCGSAGCRGPRGQHRLLQRRTSYRAAAIRPSRVTPSSSVPISSCRSTRAVASALTTTFSWIGGSESGQIRLHGVDARDEPDELKRAARVRDRFLIAADRCRAGLDSVAVTPGSTAPDASVIVPPIAPTPCAAAGRVAEIENSSTAMQHPPTFLVVMMSLSFTCVVRT